MGMMSLTHPLTYSVSFFFCPQPEIITRFMWRSACLRALHNITELERQLSHLARLIPSNGMTSAQLQAVIDDELPTVEPHKYGANSLRELLEAFPGLFTVTQTDPGGRWSAQSTVGDPDSKQKALYAVTQACLAQRRRSDNPHGFVPLETLMQKAGVQNTDVVDDIVAGATALESRVSVRLRPRRTPRRAVVFVDGDELSAEAVNDMCDELRLIKSESSLRIFRRQRSAPLSEADGITPDTVPTCVVIEKYARQTALRDPHIRQDIIYMCSARLFATYAEGIAPQNEFPDADVYVCAPSRIALLKPKKLLPY